MSILFKSFKRVKRMYSRESTQEVFKEILEKKKFTRFLVSLFTKLKSTKILTFLLSLYSLKALLSINFPSRKGQIIAVATTANEFSYVNYINNCLGDNQIEVISPNIKNIFNYKNIYLILAIFLYPKRTLKYIKIIGHFNNDDFITACLRANCLGYYLKMKYILSMTNPKAVIVTSNYSADSCALVSAAKSLNISVIFYPHGVVTDFNKPIDLGYDIAIFSGQYGFDIFKNHIENFNPKIVFCGIKGKTLPLELDVLGNGFPKKIGILLTAKTNMDTLKKLVSDLNEKWNVEKILIRPHPVDLIIPDFISLKEEKNVEISPKGTSLIDDIDKVNFAFIGNSSVHLEVLKLGVPTVYFENLDSYDFDTNRFIKFGVVVSAKKIEDIDLEKIIIFYSGNWIEKIKYFDAGYGMTEDEIKVNIKKQILEAIKTLN